MTGDLLRRFQGLSVWKRGDKRAPHKPLLALWAIGRCLRGAPRLASYALVDRELAELLRQFGPHRKTTHTEDPFWRMRRDGVWEVDRPSLVRSNAGGGPYKGDLRRHRIRGGLTESDYAALQRQPQLARQIAECLVARHFPATLKDAVLEATAIPPDGALGLELRDSDDWIDGRQRRRDPKFRAQVLAAYGSRCAVCEFAVRLGDKPLAIEAAHIKWHEYNGPAEVDNGLALCSLHHDLFDRGAFTLMPELQVIVADTVRGTGAEASLGRFHGKALRAPPGAGFPRPNPRFLAWHRSEVFRVP